MELTANCFFVDFDEAVRELELTNVLYEEAPFAASRSSLWLPDLIAGTGRRASVRC